METIYVNGNFVNVGNNNNNKQVDEILKDSSEDLNSFKEVEGQFEKIKNNITKIETDITKTKTNISNIETDIEEINNTKFNSPLRKIDNYIELRIGTSWYYDGVIKCLGGLGYIGDCLGVVPAGLATTFNATEVPIENLDRVSKDTNVVGGIRSAQIHNQNTIALESLHTDGKYYQVETDTSGKAFVNVPGNTYTLPEATYETLGGIKLNSDKLNLRRLGIHLDTNGNAYINIGTANNEPGLIKLSYSKDTENIRYVKCYFDGTAFVELPLLGTGLVINDNKIYVAIGEGLMFDDNEKIKIDIDYIRLELGL